MSLHSEFDEIVRQFSSGDAVASVDKLCQVLAIARDASVAAGQLPSLRRECQSHPIWRMLLEDPYTRRAYEKPRGYAGDAVMMDFVYSGEAPSETSAVGRMVFAATTRLPNGKSVVWRRDHVATRIDDIASKVDRPVISSVACGHLRECQKSVAVRDGRIGMVYAFDQDSASLDVVRLQPFPDFVRATIHNVY